MQTPLVMWPVMHAGNPITPLWTEWHTGVKIWPCPKLRLRAVISTIDCSWPWPLVAHPSSLTVHGPDSWWPTPYHRLFMAFTVSGPPIIAVYGFESKRPTHHYRPFINPSKLQCAAKYSPSNLHSIMSGESEGSNQEQGRVPQGKL